MWGIGDASGKERSAPKSKESLLNALICSINTNADETESVTLHTSTCKRYPSIHAFYTSIHESNTRRRGIEFEDGGNTDNRQLCGENLTCNL